MSFWSKIKQWFGIGGVKFALQVAPSYSKQGGVVTGKLQVTSKSDQTLKEIKVKIEEEWQSGRGEEKTRKVFELGSLVLPGFTIKASETKEFDLSIPFTLLKSNNDELKDKGGALRTLGKLGSLVSAEKSDYFLVASGDVQGTAFGPSKRKPIRLIN